MLGLWLGKERAMRRRSWVKQHTIRAALLALGLMGAATAFAQEECRQRGELDTAYCDENRDLVADAPRDARRLKNPSTLVFAYTPIEDPAVYQNLFKPFQDHLAACTAKKVVYFTVQSNAAQIEAMRAGRLHVAGFASGQTGFAVNLAGAVPFAIKGNESGPRTYTQVVNTKDGKRTRVRVGPFGSREEADKAAATLKKAGLAGAVLAL